LQSPYKRSSIAIVVDRSTRLERHHFGKPTRHLKTFRYRPEFVAGFERSRIVELSIALVFVGGVGAAFIWAAFTNLNQYFGFFAIGVTVAMVALVLY